MERGLQGPAAPLFPGAKHRNRSISHHGDARKWRHDIRRESALEVAPSARVTKRGGPAGDRGHRARTRSRCAALSSPADRGVCEDGLRAAPLLAAARRPLVEGQPRRGCPRHNDHHFPCLARRRRAGATAANRRHPRTRPPCAAAASADWSIEGPSIFDDAIGMESPDRPLRRRGSRGAATARARRSGRAGRRGGSHRGPPPGGGRAARRESVLCRP